MDEGQNTGKIDLGIRSKELTGGLVRLSIDSGILSSLSQLDNAELLTILHTIAQTEYARSTERQHGFIYTFPMVFGE